MKLRAIRLAEVGRFATPVAVEGLSDGLNVLAGPNELGKSTLLSALIAAFTFKQSSSDKAIKALQPYAGGAPQIEVDFDADGRGWRLTKRFLQGANAELVDRSTGAVIARRDDVQAHLDRFASGPEGLERFGLVWVRQGESLVGFKHADGVVDPLRRVLEREVHGLAVDELASRVHARIQARLATLASHKGTRPSGEFKEALEARDRTAEAARSADNRLTDSRERLTALARASAAAAALRDPVAAAARASRRAAAAAAHAAAVEAQTRANTAALAARTATAAADAARQALDRFGAAIARRELALADEARHRTELDGHLSAGAAAVEAHAGAERRRAEAVAAFDAAAAALEAGRAAHDAAAAIARRDALARRRDEVAALAAEHASRASAWSATAVSTETVLRLRRDQSALEALAARLAAAAPDVVFDLAAGGAKQIQVGRKALGATRRLTVHAPTQIDIAGIGRITITPGGGSDAAAARVEHDFLAATVAADLKALGVADLAGAELRLDAQRAEAVAIEGLRARIDALAPAGLDALSTELASLAAATAGMSAPVTLPDLSALDTERHRRAAERDDAERALVAAAKALGLSREAGIRIEAAIEAAARRAVEAARDFGDPATWDDLRCRLTEERMKADADAAAAIREAAAFRDAMPDADRMTALIAADRTAADEFAAAEAALVRLDLEIRECETALRADSDVDIEQVARSTAEAAAAAHRRADALTRDVDSLRLLDRLLADAVAADHLRLAAPLLERISPYLEQVLPGARLGLDASLAPSGLVRGTDSEPLDRLSRGTAEQIAVLARLGLGRLLADRGAPAPVILDDALVYADDRRIEAMFDVLREAARYHQVIVLTCRERTFAAIGGTTLRLTRRD
jgi:uncharacterized protein YhaN